MVTNPHFSAPPEVLLELFENIPPDINFNSQNASLSVEATVDLVEDFLNGLELSTPTNSQISYFPCVFPGCKSKCSKLSSIKSHYKSKHSAEIIASGFKDTATGIALHSWLSSNGLVFCHFSKTIMTTAFHLNNRTCLCLPTNFMPTVSTPLPQLSSQPSNAANLSDAELLDILQLSLQANNVNQLVHIPKRSINRARRILTCLILDVARSPTNILFWTKFLVFPKVLLSYPSGSASPAEWTKARLDDWELNWIDVFLSIGYKVFSGKKEQQLPSNISKFNTKRCLDLVKVGRFGDALRSLKSSGLNPDNDLTFQALLGKHPDAELPSLPAADLLTYHVVSDDIVEAAKSFSRGTAAGPSGFSADHFKELLFMANGVPDASLLGATVELANVVLSGKCSNIMAPFFGSARLLALQKSDGGVRPIAIGDFFRRLISKAAMKKVLPVCPSIFGNIQLGVKVPNACEMIVHDLNSFASRGIFHTNVLLKLDWKNAFNEFSRRVMFEEVRKFSPGLSGLVEWIYGSKANLFYFDKILKSAAGTQQGDPLGPFLFCLVQQRFLRDIPSTFDISYQKFYMDDGNIVLPLKNVPAVLDYFEAEGTKVGLTLNINKCELWAPNLSTQLDSLYVQDPTFAIPNLSIQQDLGVKVLGGPVSNAQNYVASFFQNRVAKVKDLIENVLTIDNSQAEYLLLRNCIAAPQLGFHLRVCPSTLIEESLLDYDRVIQESITRISGGIVDPYAAAQLALPLSNGGLGLPSAQAIAPAAFLGSVSSSMKSSSVLVRPDYFEVVDLLASRFKHCSDSERLQLMSKLDVGYLSTVSSPQKFLTSLIKEEAILDFQALISSAPNKLHLLSRWNSIKNGSSKSAFSIIPDEKYKSFPNPIFACMLRHFLGLPHEAKKSSLSFAKCKFCSKYAAQDGSHALDCKANGVMSRHDDVKTLLSNVCSQAGIANAIEERNLDPESQSRPADVILCNWNHADAWIDVAVVNPCSASMKENSAGTMNYAIDNAAKGKRRKYADLIKDMGVSFVPFVMDVFGNLNKEGHDCLQRISSIGARRNGKNWKIFYRDARSKLVCSVLSNVAMQILNCLDL